MDQQLFFFTELQSIDYSELEGLIDPKLDADFLAEIAPFFDALGRRDTKQAESEAA
jgi:hypothetical protein